MSAERKCVAAVCVCGGWVMLAVLGHGAASDRETWRDAGEMAGEGFTIRHPVTVDECRTMAACKHRGLCTTAPHEIPDPRQLTLLEPTP